MIKPPNNSSGTISGAAGGDLTGEFPDPAVLDDSHAHTGATLSEITHTSIASANKDGAAATPSMRTLGTSSTQACAGNDARLSNPRAPTDSAGGDLAGTYPNPTVAKVANTTPGTIGLALLDDVTAADARSTIGITLGNAVTQFASATDTAVVSRGSTLDLCSLTIPNIKTAGVIPNWGTANDSNLSGNISGGVLTLTRANSGGTDSRANGNFPMLWVEPGAMNDMLTARIATSGTLDFNGGGLFAWNGFGDNVMFYAWNTTLELHHDPAGAFFTTSILAGQYIWQRIIRRGPHHTFYYSTSTAEPANYGNTVGTDWVFVAHTTIQTSTRTTKPRMGIGLSYPAGSLGSYDITLTTCRYERL